MASAVSLFDEIIANPIPKHKLGERVILHRQQMFIDAMRLVVTGYDEDWNGTEGAEVLTLHPQPPVWEYRLQFRRPDGWFSEWGWVAEGKLPEPSVVEVVGEFAEAVQQVIENVASGMGTPK